MLEANNVVKNFDGFRALDGANMTVPRGAVYGLVGPNGAGKSTIIRHFTGVYRPDSGQVTLDGQPVYENPAAKSRMAVIPDDWYYFSPATIRDMMRFYRGFYPNFSMERYEKLKEVAAREHRSVAQQTIVAVEAMVSGEYTLAKEEPRRSLYLDFDTKAKRAARIKKCQELFESAKAHPLVLPPDAPSPVDVIREAREERSMHIGEVLDEIMERRVSYGGN